jgi:hypothetical protein
MNKQQLQSLWNDKQFKQPSPVQRRPRCPVHRLVGKQSFSPDEARFYVRHQNQLRICDGCFFFFKSMQKENVYE